MWQLIYHLLAIKKPLGHLWIIWKGDQYIKIANYTNIFLVSNFSSIKVEEKFPLATLCLLCQVMSWVVNIIAHSSKKIAQEKLHSSTNIAVLFYNHLNNEDTKSWLPVKHFAWAKGCYYTDHLLPFTFWPIFPGITQPIV